MTQDTNTASGAADLLDLIEAYAEARHRQGHSSYNAQTATALQAVKDALAAGQATAAQQPDSENLRKALQFYADSEHFIKADGDAWDTVSGEPQNYWCDEAGTATVEDGSIARLALSGHPVRFEDDAAQPAAQQGAAYAELPDEREAFESWLRSVWTAGYGCPKCDSGKYVHGEAQRFWECWQARASHGQAPADAKALAEADRRAGEAERLLATCKEDVMRFEQVRSRMKYQWGADQRVSFDEVWDEALALKKGARADSVQDDAAREAIEKVLALFPFNALIQKFSVNNGPCLTADNDDEFYSVKRVLAFLTEIKTTLDAARKQGEKHDR